MPPRVNKANVEDPEIGKRRIKTCYGDTNSSTGEELVLKWGDIYNMFRDEKYPEVEEEDKDVFTNIKRSGLHRVAARPPVFPCADVISWIISRVKVDNRRVMAIDDEQVVGSFRPEYIEVYYKLPRSEVDFTNKWLEKQTHDVHATMKSWWVHTKRFRVRPFKSTYPTASLREPYKLVAMMMCRLFGDPDAKEFQQVWVQLMHEVCNKGTIFNWSGILSCAIVHAVNRARRVLGENEPAHFYMSSYLLDVICATNPFPGLHWMWTPTEPPVHIYCSLLWEH